MISIVVFSHSLFIIYYLYQNYLIYLLEKIILSFSNIMKIKLENDKIIDLEYKNFKKMMLIFNAIEDGWNVIKMKINIISKESRK